MWVQQETRKRNKGFLTEDLFQEQKSRKKITIENKNIKAKVGSNFPIFFLSFKKLSFYRLAKNKPHKKNGSAQSFLSLYNFIFYININKYKQKKMKKDLMFGVKSLIAAIMLVSCVTFFCVSFTSAPFGVLLLSTCLLATSVTYYRILWSQAIAK